MYAAATHWFFCLSLSRSPVLCLTSPLPSFVPSFHFPSFSFLSKLFFSLFPSFFFFNFLFILFLYLLSVALSLSLSHTHCLSVCLSLSLSLSGWCAPPNAASLNRFLLHLQRPLHTKRQTPAVLIQVSASFSFIPLSFLSISLM